MHARPAEPRDDAALADLFRRYQEEFRYELGDQDVTAEGRRARDAYADGALLVAEDGDDVVGCVAFQPWGGDAAGRRCRMRRMYVPVAHRGRGVGRLLAVALLDEARRAGYVSMVLDTSAPMEAARALYRGLGFEGFEPDYEAPCREVEYLSVRLGPGGAGAAGAAHGG